MDTAKRVRLNRILRKSSGRSLIVPIDHGLTMGPLKGIESSRKIANWIENPQINAVIAHKGILTRLLDRGFLYGKGLILHINGMNSLADVPDNKTLLTDIRSAVRLGVDAVSLQVNFTGHNDQENWAMLGRSVDEAAAHGLPVLTMLYDKVPVSDKEARAKRMRQLTRVAVELGTDALKISIGEDELASLDLIRSLSEDTHVFVAGGDLSEGLPLLQQMNRAVNSGAAGFCMGRNIFERPEPAEFVESLSNVLENKFLLQNVAEKNYHVV